MRLRLLCAAATLLAVTACTHSGAAPVTGGGPTVLPAPAPPPTTRAPELVRLGPSALRYLVHRGIHTEQRIQGRTVTLDRGVSAYVSATITGPADSLGYPLVLAIDSLVADSGTFLPPGVNLAAVRGLRYLAHVASTGELRNALPSDSTLAWTAAQVFGTFQGFYPRLPTAGLTLAAEWTDTVTTIDRGMVEVTTTYINHSRAAAWEERSGARCLRLEVTSTFSLAGAGAMGGQPRELSGSGMRSTLQFVAADGRYLGGEIRDSMAITVRFPEEGETVPGTQVSQITISVLP